LVKNNKYLYNELVIKNNIGNPIKVKTDVTVAENGVCETSGDKELKITARGNGSVTAGGKAESTGHDGARVIARGNCKVTLNDNAVGNAYGNCSITLHGRAKASSSDDCTVHAHDEAAVSAYGNSKIFTYQQAVASGTDVASLTGKDSSTLIGQKKCTIKAQDSCMVYATDECKVQATGNCLIIADKNADVMTQKDCVVMANNNPNITLFDQCESINMDQITELNIMGTLKKLAKTKAFRERPYIALQLMMNNIPPERKEAVGKRLVTMGCKDQVSTKNYLYALIKVGAPAKRAGETRTAEAKETKKKEKPHIGM
jgi:hypothetical protein